MVMVLNTTFNKISIISWRSVFLVGETGVPGESYRSYTSLSGIRTHNVGGDR